ncbi:MAG: glycosyltransferase family 39 protein [Candidatus Coatesbacteria bacterium]|nr:glycosyltransferase family 39 protein [Candidatus Coatesbacteria bacterium]
MIRRAADFAKSRIAARAAFVVCAAVMVALFLALIAVMIAYGSGIDSRLVAYLIPRYYRLVWGLFASVVLTAWLASRLDRIHKSERPRYKRIADRVRLVWSKVAISSPVWLRAPLIVVLMGAFVFLIPRPQVERMKYSEAVMPPHTYHGPQLIAESRGANAGGFSRVRASDNVMYAFDYGYKLCAIDVTTGEVIWQGLVGGDNLAEAKSLPGAVDGLPDGVIAVVVRHDLSWGLAAPELDRALRLLGSTVSDQELGKKGYVLISVKEAGRFVRVFEAAGDNCVVAVNLNLVMRAYFLLRRLLPEINVLALIGVLVLLVAAFARANHGVKWPDAFRYGLMAGPVVGCGVLWLRHSSASLVIVAGLAALLGLYLSYRDAFINRRSLAYKTVVVAIVLLILAYPHFVARNYEFVRMLALSIAIYLAWKTYTVLFGQDAALSFPLFAFVATRVPLVMIAYISNLFLHVGQLSPWRLGTHWDAGYYLDIASSGYHLRATWSTAPFPPFFPFLIRTMTPLFGDPVIAGTVVANLAFVASLCLLYHLANETFGISVAERSVLILAVGPASFFFSAIYTESVFLLCCLAFFILASKGRWLAAGLCGMLAALTRSVGIALAVAGIWECLRQAGFRFRGVRPSAAWLLLILCGCGLLSFVLYGATGDFAANVTSQQPWGREPMQNPFAALKHHLIDVNLNFDSLGLFMFQYHFSNALHVLATLLALIAIVPIARQVGMSYALFTALGVILPLSTGTTDSMLRYAEALFPITLLLGVKSDNPNVFRALLVSFALLMTFFAILHANGLVMT